MRDEMRKWRSMLSLMLAVLLLMPVLTGCRRKELDAVKAVEAYLKAETRGEFDDYAEITGMDEEELRKTYDETMDEMMEMFDGMDLLDVDFGDRFREEIEYMMASVKYEVVGSERDEDGNYTVDVDVYPSDAFVIVFGNIMDMAKTATEPEELGDLVLQAFHDAVDEQSYGEAERYQVHIVYNEDTKQYETDEEDVKELAMHFFDLEGAMENLLTPSGTVYDNPYLNWTSAEWGAASEEERTQCCLAIIQEAVGASAEDMAGIDVNDLAIQASIQQMKDGLELSFSGGTSMGANFSVGDYVEFIKNEIQF